MTFRRALYLSLEYRLLTASLTFAAAFVVTGSVRTSAWVVGVDAALKVVWQAIWLRWRA